MKKGIIVVSFGTSYEETRKLTIEAIEKRVEKEFDQALVLRAFTSEIIRKKLRARDGLEIDNVPSSLERIKEQGIEEVFLQPLHIIKGHEYEKILRQAKEFSSKNKDMKIQIGSPLLTSQKDYERVVDSLNLEDGDQEKGLVYMGHGSDHEADISYERLEGEIRSRGIENTFIATVEGSRTIHHALEEIIARGIKKVELKPFMLVAGDHAINDMASDEEDSWKTILEEAGLEVSSQLKGLGENEEIQDIFIDHLKDIYK